MTSKIVEAPIRLAFREEGKVVNCYVAQRGTMEDAILIAAVDKATLDMFPEVWANYQTFMRETLTIIIKEATGETPVWPYGPRPAPEDERSGHA